MLVVVGGALAAIGCGDLLRLVVPRALLSRPRPLLRVEQG